MQILQHEIRLKFRSFPDLLCLDSCLTLSFSVKHNMVSLLRTHRLTHENRRRIIKINENIDHIKHWLQTTNAIYSKSNRGETRYG